MKKIVVLHTGGTISMKEDKDTGTVAPEQDHPLYDMLPSLATSAEIEDEVVFHLPSPHMTPAHMLKLGQRIHERLANEEIHGIVITHGTDTLEETAYFLDLYLQTRKPIIVTGAMRSSNEIGSDGLYNLLTSVRVACSDEAQDKGVLVVMNDEIHSAKNVTKTSTSNVATFQSPQYGPIGIVTKTGIMFHHTLTSHESYPIQQITKRVSLIKTYAGMDRETVEAIRQTNPDGLVIEALGQGNVPPQIVEPLKGMINDGIPVVLVSRCYQGIAQDVYGYEGGGRRLKEMGIVFSNGLTGPKARIKLMIALEMTQNASELVHIFS
ncbi:MULTISPECIES: asparaginase [Pontibacillus]|uniref:asparaginase n=1 Tax=Pontibacillus chungwhensis TaxID=265426 RepID=A0ABY8URV8_9BACI|nr:MULTISPECIES: asparaginase [Pontibacillus]MCD5323017.1 asparaginase [Pontibacillus sp. HN14]WIF96411.1 asparaginase [Pontibacillus chungwhensis]